MPACVNPWLVRIVMTAVPVLFCSATEAGPLSLDGSFSQGGLVIGRTAPDSQIWLDDRRIGVSSEGVFVFGFGRDAKPDARLRARFVDGTETVRRLAVARRTYNIQRIEGLPKRMVTPSPAQLERIREESRIIRAARGTFSSGSAFADGFIWPVRGIVSGVYGSQRILNGKPRRPHLGIDIAAPAGTPVMAAARGTVTLAEPDLYFTGGTIIIDHGLGISSVYSHLSALLVRTGQAVNQGEAIGSVGSTGRSTGPHLDWRVNWFQERLDPALLVAPMTR